MAAPSALQYEKEITVEHYQCDLRDQLPMGGLLRQIQQISTDHCDALGITAQRYQDTNTAFLLAKISVECLRPIVAGERLRVVTRPSAPVRAIYYRFTSILDEQGREICSADARWTLIDTQKRRILRNPPPALGLPFTAPAERTLELSMPGGTGAAGRIYRLLFPHRPKRASEQHVLRRLDLRRPASGANFPAFSAPHDPLLPQGASLGSVHGAFPGARGPRRLVCVRNSSPRQML